MKNAQTTALKAVEIELKLALHSDDPSTLEQRLARIPVLARRKASHERLHNTYYDTPGDALHHQRIALRIRRAGSEADPVWLQTLKTGGSSDSALSQRGEWETTVPGPALQLDRLQATPWSALDPDGALFHTLVARFTTDFRRTCWTVRNRDGSAVEVALDLGQIVVGGHSTAICELEIELKAGDPAALFRVARQIASAVAVMPLGVSKAQRGFALAHNALDLPLRAQPPGLTLDMPVPQVATHVLREMFHHFTANLVSLCTSDDPEVVHQARVGWRRFKSALKLFKKTPVVKAAPSWLALTPVLKELGSLRDMEVASLETLPMLANTYAGGHRKRQDQWQALQQALAQAADHQRQVVRKALHDPAVGSALLDMTEWLENHRNARALSGKTADEKIPLRQWARGRIEHLRSQLKTIRKEPAKPDTLHRARILAKRIRYSVEALRTVLPKRRAQHWYQQAAHLQSAMGAERDVRQAMVIAGRLKADAGLLEFLKKVADGRKRPR